MMHFKNLMFVGMAAFTFLTSNPSHAAITDFKTTYITTFPLSTPDHYSIQAYCPSQRINGGWEICERLGIVTSSDLVGYLKSADINREEFKETISQLKLSENLTMVTLIAAPLAMLFDLRTSSLQKRISCEHHPFEIVLHDLDLQAKRPASQTQESIVYLIDIKPVLSGLRAGLDHLKRGQIEIEAKGNRCAH